MCIVITGASGLLGRALMLTFSAYQPLGLAYSRANTNLHKIDLTDQQAIEQFLFEHRPKIIIHAAAERRPDATKQHPEQAIALNVAATQYLVKAAKAINAWLLYISTDYVFDGKYPPYQTTSQPNPLNLYGQSKWQGEKIILTQYDNACILRIPILYGQVEFLTESSITALFLLLNNPQAKVDHHAIRYPTLVDNVAKICLQLAEKSLANAFPQGILHYSDPEPYTKYEMLQTMAKVMKKPFHHIIPIAQPIDKVPRPYHCQLAIHDLNQFNIKIPTACFKQTIFSILSTCC
ncbi:MAG: hypothetical protein A3E87_02090 [Gammaproteobacteria bacterium RIFCSPHIGHO2_12_FULL_35_23]|nr:MAG: hypothetical protein A3E87_02090 [Gammaproteobacteria bacterium RIFCSPHIGHO2_12_FULL_35_23]